MKLLNPLCPLCKKNIEDHEKISIDGDESYACFCEGLDEQAKQDMVLKWISLGEDRSMDYLTTRNEYDNE